MAFALSEFSPVLFRSRFLKASPDNSPTALHAGFVESDSDIIFSRTTAFRATMIIVGLLLIVLICIARWDYILDCLFCHRFLPTSPQAQQQVLTTEMQKVWCKRAVVDAVPIIRYSAMASGCSQEPKDSTKECMICLSDFNDGEMIRILPNCSHIFHAQCIDLWFFSQISCPVCRKSLALDLPSSFSGRRCLFSLTTEQVQGPDLRDTLYNYHA
ncbi:hypothetical protein O6H91_17G071800 [Diphasiastrum complanatum]|uniref:Uncharacterized protein n=3 Tax=Diphasiastrum complanatum TaxID=34168 RepID=A0ACC2B802_DIPCM|nr:hypothetical protein O6H91_17G071100 [Diphasiastrum complanatum]KAJ7525882.1 hypothetical protein O6H91_17G071800 [Diphasiastrum complanatum]